MRASIQCDIDLVDVRLPADAMLPGGDQSSRAIRMSRRGPLRNHLGFDGCAARDSYLAAVDYAKTREQFGKPIAGVPAHPGEASVNMAVEINKGMLLALHLGRLKDKGTLKPHQVSARQARTTREGAIASLSRGQNNFRRQRHHA